MSHAPFSPNASRGTQTATTAIKTATTITRRTVLLIMPLSGNGRATANRKATTRASVTAATTRRPTNLVRLARGLAHLPRNRQTTSGTLSQCRAAILPTNWYAQNSHTKKNRGNATCRPKYSGRDFVRKASSCGRTTTRHKSDWSRRERFGTRRSTS